MTMRATRAVFGVAMGTYLALTALILGLALRHTGGLLVYSLDDPYIHMAVARTLAFHGTYGIGPEAYESASTSPLWTVLLAALARLTSERTFTWLPLFLNVVGGAWILWSFAAHSGVAALAPALRLTAAAALPVALYLPGLAVTGMEHTLHSAITLSIFIMLDRIAAGDASPKASAAYYALLALAAGVRPEAMFVGLGCGVALLATGRIRPALQSVAATAVPIVAVGLFNGLHGQYFFPNSVVAKTRLAEGGVETWAPHFGQIAEALRADPMLAALLFAIVTYAIVATFGRRRHLAPCLALVVGAILHLNYAEVGWLDRYQAYLITTGTFIVLQILADATTTRSRWVAPLVLAMLFIALPYGKVRLMLRAPVTVRNIYRAQYQLARFLAEYYPRRAVAVNDLGLIAWLHGTPLIDLSGLGSHEVLRAWKEGRFDSSYLRDLAVRRDVAVTVVYEEWFSGLIPEEWPSVAVWALDERDTPRPWRVVFYAPSATLAGELEHNLRAFVPTLPGGVTVQFVSVH